MRGLNENERSERRLETSHVEEFSLKTTLKDRIVKRKFNMRRCFAYATVALLTSLLMLSAQSPAGTAFRIEKLDPALDDVIAPDAKLETLGEHFALTEGPVWMPAASGQPGYLLFSDNAANVIYKWAAGSPLNVFLEKSGYTGNDTSNV